MLSFAKRSECNKDVSFHSLPLHNKRLLKVWTHKIGRKNLSVNNSTRIHSSIHFVGSKGQNLCPVTGLRFANISILQNYYQTNWVLQEQQQVMIHLGPHG